MYKILFACIFMISCLNCIKAAEDPKPRVSIEPGIDYCSRMCDLFKSLDCAPYYEDISLGDGTVMTCTEFCVYEMSNSIPLNPKCYVEQLQNCEDIETICQTN